MAAMLARRAAAVVPASAYAGSCGAWPLPLDGTCAGLARRILGDVMTGLGLSAEVVDDGVTMVSELAANTLHAQENVEFDGSRQRPLVGSPELWAYVRACRTGCELVCKVFDSQRRWKIGAPPDPAKVSLDSVSGRGLRVVSVLSGGRWGHHMSRARLGRWKVAGKAVWFAIPVPSPPPAFAQPLSSSEAAKELEVMLDDRGIGRRLVRADEDVAGISVLSVRAGLSVWCRDGHFVWTVPGGGYDRRPFDDLVEVAEQVVRLNEELDQPRP